MALMRWNDDRLDDMSMTVRRNTERLDDVDAIRIALAELRKDVVAGREESHECNEGLADFKREFAQQAKVQRDERKADRRWMIATLLATASIIVAALAVFVG